MPRSLRTARLLLVGAAFAPYGPVVYIARESLDPVRAIPWLAVFAFAGAGFLVAAFLLERDARRAKLLAVASAIALAAVGVVTGFGAGPLTFPVAGLGVAAAWATVLHPPRRPLVIALAAYIAVGFLLTLPRVGAALAFPWILATILIWPMQLSLAGGFTAIYATLAIAAVIAAAAFLPRVPARP